MAAHTKRKLHQQAPPFHPGVKQKQEGIYVAYTAETYTKVNTGSPMPLLAIANLITVLMVVLEAAIFYWFFGVYGLLSILITTAIYTLMDKRARQWIKGLLKNNSEGSAG